MIVKPLRSISTWLIPLKILWWTACFWAPFHFKQVYNSRELLLQLSDKFKREQRVLTSVLEEISNLPSSKWKLVQRLDGRAGTCLDSRLDVRNFLLRERRVRHQGAGLLGGAYFPAARVA